MPKRPGLSSLVEISHRIDAQARPLLEPTPASAAVAGPDDAKATVVHGVVKQVFGFQIAAGESVEERVQITARVPVSFRRAVHAACLACDTSVNEFIEVACTRLLEEVARELAAKQQAVEETERG